MKNTIVKILFLGFICIFVAQVLHAQPTGYTEPLALAIQKADYARASIKKEDYSQARESLNQLDKAVTVIETFRPSLEVETLLGQARDFAENNELNAALAKVQEAMEALKRLRWYKTTIIVPRQHIRKTEKYLAKKNVSKALSRIELTVNSTRLETLQRRTDEIREYSRLARKYIDEGKSREALESMEKLMTPLTHLQYILPLTEARGYLGEAYEVIAKKDFDKGLALINSAETKFALALKSAEPMMRGYFIKAQKELEQAKASVMKKEPRCVAFVRSVWAALQNLVAPKACKL